MQDKNLIGKLIVILFVVLWGAYAIYPPDKKLKGGIDLVGGHSLLYEIDTLGLEDTTNLSERVMDRLKQRVDPDGVRNLVWRPVGNTRLEIQMPLPPKDTTLAREKYQTGIEALRNTNVSVAELETILTFSGSARDKRLSELIRGVPERKGVLADAVSAYDVWQKAISEKKTANVISDLEQGYEKQLDRLLATNVDMNRLNEALELETKEGQETLKQIKSKYAKTDREKLIDNVVSAYTVWNRVKGPLDDPSDLMRLLRGAGVLEFRILARPSADRQEEFNDYVKRLDEKGPRYRPEDEHRWFEVSKSESVSPESGLIREWGGKKWVLAYNRNPEKVMDKSNKDWKLTAAYPTRDQTGLPAVGFEFNETGAVLFHDLTRNNLKQNLAIVLDGKIYSAPTIQSAISNRGIITGKFTPDEVNYLVSTLSAGSLDARLKDMPISVTSIGPSLGQDNRTAGFRASIIGLICVVAFMLVYYLYAGFVADFALFLNLLLLLAAIAVLEATFTMAGIAGVILTMGMAVDANVLIFERMREEKERLQSLRLIVKNGFDRALPTIIDSNVTTIITCVILYYIGTEEIKGFALVLGLGLVINIFTAFFVTKVIFAVLAKYNLIKSLPMLHFFRKPNIDWMSKQKYFWAISSCFFLIAIIAFPLRGEDKYDIEFRGGTSVQIELKDADALSIDQIRSEMKKAGEYLINSGEPLKNAKLTFDAQTNNYVLKFEKVSAGRVEAAMLSFMEDSIEKGTLEIRDVNTISFRVRSELKLDMKGVESKISDVSFKTQKSGQELIAAQVQSVGQAKKDFEIVTTATCQRLVIDAIVEAMGKYLNIQQSIKFDPNVKSYPVMQKRLGDVIGDAKAPGYVRDYLGGVAFVVDKLSPAVTTDELKMRISSMRLQPDFEKLQWRNFDVIGLTPDAGQDIQNLSENQIKYSKTAVVVMDPSAMVDEDESIWKSQLVTPELKLLEVSLSRTSELKKVTQFAGQVANQAKIAAILALILSFGAVTIYLWIRFGTVRHGLAANIATMHDIITCLGFVLISAWLAETAFGKALLISDFKFNLSIVAAILTLIGYSVNDTIIVFDRIRENQGKLKEINPQIINNSINQTLSRTVLTSSTVLLVMIIMYIFGGDGARGFSFVMMLGAFFGCYSSIAIASPLLLGWKGALGIKTSAEPENNSLKNSFKTGA